jgi:hypothetical protein
MNPRACVAALLLFVPSVWWASACSLRNREGPDVTCADLECGRINACKDGIIAQCVDQQTVLFHACPEGDTCGEDWQIDGEYRCIETETDCEGCRPERTEGCDGTGSGGNGGSGAGGQGGNGGSGGSGATAGSAGSGGAGGGGGNGGVGGN